MKSADSLRLSILLALACGLPCARLGTTEDPLRWIPRDAELVAVLTRPAQAAPSYFDLGSALLLGVDMSETIRKASEQTGVDILKDSTRLIVAKLHSSGSGFADLSVAEGEWGGRKPAPLSDGTFRMTPVGENYLVFGDSNAVERTLALAGSGGESTPQPADLRHALELAAPGAQIRGAARGDWFGFKSCAGQLPEGCLGGKSLCKALSSIKSMAFSGGLVQDSARFLMKTDAGDTDSAMILADALRGEMASLRLLAKSTAPPEVQQLLDNATVRSRENQVELEMEATGAALARVRNNPYVRALLRWQLSENERELRQSACEVLDVLMVGKGKRVADVGAGLGFFSVRLARAVGAGGKVFAEDISPGAIDQLRRRIREGDFRQVEVILGDPDNPRLPSQDLDAVLIFNSYHEMPRYKQMLGQIRESLKPGARLLIAEPRSPTLETESREQQMKEHVIAPALVEQELKESGFEVVFRDDNFIVKTENTTAYFLILSVKPGPEVR
jgi:ubiquinone/menaquinone biosynthesis C-methylase UbiE